MATISKAFYGYELLRPGQVATLNIRTGKTYITEPEPDTLLVGITDCEGCGATHKDINCPYCNRPNDNVKDF